MNCKRLFLISFLALVLLFQNGCRTRNEFYRQQELFHFLYINDVKDVSKKTIVMVLVGSSCGTCIESTKDVLKVIKPDQFENIAIVMGDELAISEYSPLISKNIERINSNTDSLTYRGLLFPTDIILFIDPPGKIKKWFEINYLTKQKIINEISSFNNW